MKSEPANHTHCLVGRSETASSTVGHDSTASGLASRMGYSLALRAAAPLRQRQTAHRPNSPSKLAVPGSGTAL